MKIQLLQFCVETNVLNTILYVIVQPYGMCGGEPGTCGRNLLIRNNGVTVNIGGRCSTDWNVGERLRLETPGAGGYGHE